MESTIQEFWNMIWQRKSHAIIMLSSLVENGRVMAKILSLVIQSVSNNSV